MKYIRFVINKRDIFDEVSQFTAYTGGKSSQADADFYNRVATIAEDSPLLDRYWRDACAMILERLRDFVTDSEIKNDSLFIELGVGNSFDEGDAAVIEDSLCSALSSSVTAAWFRITCPERKQEWEEETSKSTERLLSKLCHRKAPVRL